MIYTICNGADLNACRACRRHVSQHDEQAVEAITVRISPLLTARGECKDWVHLPPRDYEKEISRL